MLLRHLFPDLPDSVLSEDAEIILLGAGDVGQHLHGSLLRYGLQPHFFVDANASLLGTRINGTQVIGFEDLVRNHHRSLVIVASYRFHDELLANLESSRFPSSKSWARIWRSVAAKSALPLIDKRTNAGKRTKDTSRV